MTHPQEQLADYVLGELSPEVVRAVEPHLASCETCRAEVRTLRETLVTMVDSLPDAAAPEAAWGAIQAHLRTETPANIPEPRFSARSKRSWQPFALAASLVIAVGGLFWGYQARQSYQQVQSEQRKVAGWLSRPDVAAQQLTDAEGERLGSVLTLSDGRALFILRDAPPPGSSYQAWGYGDAPTNLGLTNRTLLEVPYTDYEVLEISLEPKTGSSQPTQPLGRVSVEGNP